MAYVRLRLAAEPPAPQVCDAAARPRADDFRLRGKSFLVAYNWDFCNAAFPDGTPPAASPEALWALWRVWKGTKKHELRVEQSSSTVEQSLRSSLPGRVHIH